MDLCLDADKAILPVWLGFGEAFKHVIQRIGGRYESLLSLMGWSGD
ncbi:hypothetical protein TorRG33x02_056710 [Trema orientale]|uniref:Uncharacterized protein n=1 Tax=Trema orientale TaxID=63057 RepID=A0A2P5FKX0_TREOI|nr:hypothetical protein TorRG33x02_056710 [Trema orientale]